MKKSLPCHRCYKGFADGFSLIEMLLAIVGVAILVQAAASISVSQARSSITTHLAQSLRGDADRIINLIRLDMGEADAVFATDVGGNCTDGGNGLQAADTLLLKIRHPFVTNTRTREFAFICYYERANPQNNKFRDLWRYGRPYGVDAITTNFNGSNYLGSGFLDTAGAITQTLVRPMTTLRPIGGAPATPTFTGDFNSVLYSLELRSQNTNAGSVWLKAYLVSGIRATTAGHCVSPMATFGATNQATAAC